jgi:predicted lipoprotein with Yx(FWY)xxD motif/plastocyanin
MKQQSSIKNLGVVMSLAFATCAFSDAYPTQFVRAVSDDGSEYILADSTGRTLYTFDPDPADGVPVCGAANACEEKWPPVLLNSDEVAAVTAPFGVAVRASGLSQLTHNGKPLYTFHLDRKPGNNFGDGAGGVWHDIHQDVDVAGCKLADFVENISTINVSGHTYTPKCLRVKKGSSISFTASSMHPLNAMKDVMGFANPLRKLGAQRTNFTHQFLNTGLFGYFCENHGDINGGGMAGVIEVVE